MKTNYSRYRKWYWGHGCATAIKSKEYQVEKNLVSEIILDRVNYPFIKTGINFIDRWLLNAHNGEPCPSGSLISHLWGSGIRGTDILIEASALWLFKFQNPNRIFNMNCLDHYVGNKVIRIVPHWRRDIGGPHHKVVGRYINGNLENLFISVLKRLKCKSKMEIERKNRMYIPIEFASPHQSNQKIPSARWL